MYPATSPPPHTPCSGYTLQALHKSPAKALSVRRGPLLSLLNWCGTLFSKCPISRLVVQDGGAFRSSRARTTLGTVSAPVTRATCELVDPTVQCFPKDFSATWSLAGVSRGFIGKVGFL